MTDDILEAEEEPPDPLESFHAERRGAITSTDVPKILGLSRYGSPLTVYRDKRGETEDRPQSLPAWIGQRLESLVAELYATATGTPVRPDDGFYLHPTYPWLGTHLDRRAVSDGRLVVELKTRNSTRGWGEDGSADVPADVWCQVQVQAACVDAREVHVAALFSNSQFRCYRVAPDPAFMETLIPDLEKFWFVNVVGGVPPLASGADVDREIVSRVAGGNTGIVKAATPEQEALVAQFRLALMNAAQAKFAFEEAKSRIMQLIGPDADGLRGSFGIIWWRRTKDVVTTEWDQVAKVYRAAAVRLLDLAAPGDDDGYVRELADIAAQVDVAEGLYTSTRTGSRVFRPTLREE